MKHGYCDGIGEVKLTREQYRKYQELIYSNDSHQFCRSIWKAREKNASLKERELSIIEKEEKELSKWHWCAAGVMVLVFLILLTIAFSAGGNRYDGVFAMFPMIPAIVAVAIWGENMEETLLEGKDPLLELFKNLGIAIIAGLLMYISFIFILLISLIIKNPLKLFK